MNIEKYTERYKEDFLHLVKEFYADSLSEYDGAFDIESVNNAIIKAKDTTYLLIIDGKAQGVFAGQTTSSPLNEDKVYQELIWFVSRTHRRHGVRFLLKIEKILKKEGYVSIIMACMHNSKTAKLFSFYKRCDYIPFETHFMKRL